MSGHVIVIPVHDESATIGDVAARAAAHGPVLVVDDGSTDGSGPRAEAAGVDVLRLPRRSGKGAALRYGFAEALARGAERVVTLDGDGQHDPAEIPRLLEAALAAPDALVIGGRLGADGEPAPLGSVTEGRRHAVRVAGFFLDWITRTPVRDTQSGFRVYPASLLTQALGRHGGFVFESEVLVRATARGHDLVEVPVRARASAGRRSRFRPGRDGLAVTAYLVGRAVAAWAIEVDTVARALVRPFTTARRRERHRELMEFTAGTMAAGPLAWLTAVGVFAAHRTAETWRGWWRDARAERIRLVALASVAAPVLLVATLTYPLLRRAGVDLVSPLVERAYSQERLARTFAPRAAAAIAPEL